MNQTIQYRTAEQVSSDNIGMFFCIFSSKKNILVSRENSGLKAVWSDSAQCSFSGKEKDSETGYYYFGARYYNSDLSLWLSVDPMSDKYPSLSPYNYCAWNPMKLVDPDGKETIDDLSVDQPTSHMLLERNAKRYEQKTSILFENDIYDDGDIVKEQQSDKKTSTTYYETQEKTRVSKKFVGAIPMALSIALYDGPELGPADVVAGAGVAVLSIGAGIAWIVEEVNTYSTNKSSVQKYSEHVKGARSSTWNKHTKKRPGELSGKNRNDNRGDKNKKHQSHPNPNKQKK
ncbi:MAG: RHS repeat-associated core domain-containing protein [Bacteroidales bacterium]|nr:RHS repeat-associated core domain-containing protein [Bacteroidales bacterium]